jgi:squalene-associated FAD-dependent desaturase
MVVGGGLAGISAALEAADCGAQVTVVERRARLGGLTWSFRRKGLWFDNGQHVFMRCCTAYLAFLGRIGARDQVHLQHRLDVPVVAPSGVRSSIRRSGLPAPLHMATAIARYRHLSVGDRARLLPAVLALRKLDPQDPELDEVRFADWLRRRHQGTQAIERLWDLIVLPTLNVTSADAPLSLATKVFRTGLLDRADGADIGWARVPLSRLHGDNAQRALERAGVDILTGTSVTSIETHPSGFAVSSSSGVLRSDAVVVCIPPRAAAGLLAGAGLPPVERLGSSPIVNVHLVLDRKVMDLPFAAAVDSPVQFVFDRTEQSGATKGQCLSISLSAADEYIGRRPEDLVGTFHEAIGDLFPAARRAKLVDAVVSREHDATFRAVPGSAAWRPQPRTSIPGLAVAGAWCATGWPATMEGAVRSGAHAARVLTGSTPTIDGSSPHSTDTAVWNGSSTGPLQEALH